MLQALFMSHLHFIQQDTKTRQNDVVGFGALWAERRRRRADGGTIGQSRSTGLEKKTPLNLKCVLAPSALAVARTSFTPEKIRRSWDRLSSSENKGAARVCRPAEPSDYEDHRIFTSSSPDACGSLMQL